MFNLFSGLFDMAKNYEERKVARFENEKKDIMVDTCSVTDSEQPYETAIIHPNYNDGECVVVQLYDSKEEAEIGHDKWVKVLTNKKLPKTLKDVSSCEILKLFDSVGVDIKREHKKKELK